MKSFLTFAALLGATSSFPTPNADPIRILPFSWSFNLTSLRGPGCPDHPNKPSTRGFSTRTTFGMNTVDGSEIYYWHVAYPSMHASVGATEDEAHTWCETTLKYTELDNNHTNPKPSANYRLRLHKNGTRMIATYDLDEGVSAKWKFTYYVEDDDDDDDELIDTISHVGPFKRNEGGIADNSLVAENSKQYAFPKCGEGIIKYRTDLYVNSKNAGAKGEVASEYHAVVEGKKDYYGAQQGFSYDWEKCTM